MELQMRNTTFISSVVLSVACVSAANAALTFDNFLTAQSTFAGPTAWASPPASQPIFGASGTRSVYAYDNGGSPSSASVSGGTATLTASGQGAAGLQYVGNAQDLTAYTFSFNLSFSALPGNAKATMLFYGTGGFQALYNVNYTGAGSYTVDLSTGPSWASGPVDFTAVYQFSLYLDNKNPTLNSLTLSVSNFTYTPAPGAIALLGAAGLIAARRRRD